MSLNVLTSDLFTTRNYVDILVELAGVGDESPVMLKSGKRFPNWLHLITRYKSNKL